METGLIGRDAEIAEIRAFLSRVSGGPAALVIAGEDGIGKTTIWRHALQADGRPARVLTCQPAPAERPLAFSALDDLFGDVAEEAFPALAAPRRHAVEAALLRGASTTPSPAGALPESGAAADPWPLARGILDILRALSAAGPLVIAVDDAEWLDRPTASALEFCFRRLRDEPVHIVLTSRAAGQLPLGLDRALPQDRVSRVRLGPLSADTIGEILLTRHGEAVPRYALTRLHATCGGNPLYAIECARALLGQPQVFLSRAPIPLPDSLDALVRHRVKRLASAVRRVGRLVAASSDPRERLIRAACDDGESWAAIDQSVDDGIIERDGESVRFTHPLLRSAIYSEMRTAERRQVHRRLAMVAEDVEDRAWHLALAAERPSEEVALTLDAAAAHAVWRGAPGEGATLAEEAARLTPADRSETARERMARAADCHFRAGNLTRSRELIRSALAAPAAGQPRASLLLRLATVHYHLSDWPLAEQTFREAAAEAPDDPALCAHAEQEIAFARMVAGDLPAAVRWARASLRSAELAAEPHLMAHSLARVAAFEFLQGNGVRADLLERAEALAAAGGEEPAGRMPLYGPVLVKGLILKWSDRLAEARAVLSGQYKCTLDHGDDASLPFLLYHFSELECWTGNWSTAQEYATEACRIAEESRGLTMRPATLYALALVRAHRGQVTQATELAGEALALCEQTGNVPCASQALSVLGFAALSRGDHAAALPHLNRLADATAAFGLGEPGVVRFLPDAIETLAALGHVARARSLARQLEARGETLGRPWAIASGARCRAQLDAIDGDLSGARAACGQALARFERLPMPFELGRTLLVAGLVERRAKQKTSARQALNRAIDIFERLGSPLWADKARRELPKLAARPNANGLTETERRITALVVRGHTNREVAAAVFVTENTVQTHLRHIFGKVGVRSRTELAARFPVSLLPANVQAARRNITDSGDSPGRDATLP
ncbi:MAG: AAA family ATPase [Trebonia sp.]